MYKKENIEIEKNQSNGWEQHAEIYPSNSKILQFIMKFFTF